MSESEPQAQSRAVAQRHVDLPLDRLRTIVRLLKMDDAISALLHSCNSIGEAFLFGGLVRDALFGFQGVWGDVDIFVSGPLDEEFASSISRVSRRTNFGGMRLVVGRYEVDIWELAKSRAFRFERGARKDIKGLLSTVCFSADAVAVSLVDGRIISDPSFNVTASTRVFDFVVQPSAVEILQVVRIARLCVKNNLIPNMPVARYFTLGVEQFGVSKIVSAEEKWRGRRQLDERLVRIVNEWCKVSLSNGLVDAGPWYGSEALFQKGVSNP